jgi:short-subunit dehydrogenase
MELRAARVLITGASRGIGEAVAEAFVARGATVALVARNATTLAPIAARLGGTAHPADLTDPAAVAGLLDRVESEAGPVDVLVNNAGMETTRAFWSLTTAEVEAIFRLNLVTPTELSRQAAARFRERGRGHIVNVSSLAGTVTLPGFSTYGASKAGLSHLTAGIHAELAGSGVGTTLVEVGPVHTELVDTALQYAPTARSYRRLIRLGVLAYVPAETVARSIVEAVARDRAHVRLPRRSALSALLVDVPRSVTNVAIRGIRAE